MSNEFPEKVKINRKSENFMEPSPFFPILRMNTMLLPNRLILKFPPWERGRRRDFAPPPFIGGSMHHSFLAPALNLKKVKIHKKK